MELEIVGYMVMIRKPKSDQYECLAYGRDGSPGEDVLLRDRGATMFDSKFEALKAIEDTKINAIEIGSKWYKSWEFGVMPIHKAVQGKKPHNLTE